MAVDVDWAGADTNPYRIFIPRADMPVVQASPEIRELDVDQLRLELRSLEAAAPGAPWPETHVHQTETLLSGTTFARIVEILAPYQVEFEDGQYSVRAIGANHNILDVKVNNQVSLAVFLSSGLINSPEIQDASFDGVVAIDVASPFAGTAYPLGSRRRPVNNLADALLIAESRGINEFSVRSDLTITGIDVSGYAFLGKNHSFTVTVDASADTTDCAFQNVTLQGELSGDAHIRDCLCLDVANVAGHVTASCLRGTITAAAGVLRMIDCWDGLAGVGVPVLDCDGQATDLIVRSYRGALAVRNKTGAEEASIDLMPGRLILEATVTAGHFIVKGLGPEPDDQSTGTTTVDKWALVSPESMGAGVLDEAVASHLQAGSVGEAVALLMRRGALESGSEIVVDTAADTITIGSVVIERVTAGDTVTYRRIS
jgi:hypothetical protein